VKTTQQCVVFFILLFIFVIQKTKSMYQFIQKFHSGWAYVALLLLIIAAANALIGMLSKEFTEIVRLLFWANRYTYSIVSRYGFIFLYHLWVLHHSGQMADKALRLTSLDIHN
jgi:hypothetical protein